MAKTNRQALQERLNIYGERVNATFTIGKNEMGYFYDHEKPMDARCNRIAALYSELWEQVNDYAYDNLEGDELQYYYRITD